MGEDLGRHDSADAMDGGELGAGLGDGNVEGVGCAVDTAIEPAKLADEVDGDLSQGAAAVFAWAH
ncbi:hypothetical protein [Nocardia abscessus]|uniref:hypothetical protein n=1 Tax=Nocardia abscessus TaxID=120957 RepID=UPI002B4B2F12|nr:hypothetical protein [Nocardia abscessus]